MKTKQEQDSRIPTFASRQEEAAWFDTHDMADYQDELKTVKARFAKNFTQPLSIRFDPGRIAGPSEGEGDRAYDPGQNAGAGTAPKRAEPTTVAESETTGEAS